MRKRFQLILLAALAVAACDDDFGIAAWDDEPFDVSLYSLSRPDLLGFPSAFDASSRRVVEVETPGVGGSWDVALGEEGNSLVLIPAGAFEGQTSRAGIATIEGQSFENLIEAPADTSRFSAQPVALRSGGVYVIRTRRIACGFSSAVNYAKVLVDSIDVALGFATFSVVANPSCNDRSFVSPED